MDKENPLARYKRVNELSWRQLLDQTGIGYKMLYGIINKSPVEAATISLGTNLRLKQTTGVDMLAWFEGNVTVKD